VNLGLGSGNAVEILLMLAGLSLVPAVIFTVTSFTRIIIVLSFVRQGLGTQTTPPTQVLMGIALILTLFVMSPTISQIKHVAYDPLSHHKISLTTALKDAEEPLREFMFKQTSTADIALFENLAHRAAPATRADVPTFVLIPAFVVSELKTAFQIGFLIFLPFLIIDLIVGSTLMSMGMIMLPPTFVSLPFKILLFVLVGGWGLVINSLVASFH
jgi:flagellar biosynthetic protein FliP